MSLSNAIRIAIVAVGASWLTHVSPPAAASVVLGATRVIYDSAQPEVTLKLSNDGTAPALVQAWIDTGDAHAVPSSIKVPFTVTPPVSRIDPSRSQTLRIVHTGEPLPEKRESVFWLNVLEVPPKPSATDAVSNHVQLAFRSRIKLFFRPKGLEGTPGAAPKRLNWRLTKVNGQPAIEVSNPTPYHVSVTELRVQAGAASAVNDLGSMVGPGESRVFALSGSIIDGTGANVRFSTLNDYGGEEIHETPLSSSAAPDSKGR